MNSRVKGNTSLYAVIGHPIHHTISPEIHNTIFEHSISNNIYIPLKVNSEYLKSYIKFLRDNFQGFNVTIPHKKKIIKFLDELEENAERYGAVNTVKNINGKLIGFNTDGFGFTKSLELNNVNVFEKSILIIGTGGAARVSAFELLKKGAQITIASRDRQKAEELKLELKAHFNDANISSVELIKLKESYHGIINATPVGMSPNIDLSPIDEFVLKETKFVFDMIYNPPQTKLLKMAKERGVKTINGLEMLFYQAIRSQEIWTGELFSYTITDQIYKEIKNYLISKFDIL